MKLEKDEFGREVVWVLNYSDVTQAFRSLSKALSRYKAEKERLQGIGHVIKDEHIGKTSACSLWENKFSGVSFTMNVSMTTII